MNQSQKEAYAAQFAMIEAMREEHAVMLKFFMLLDESNLLNLAGVLNKEQWEAFQSVIDKVEFDE